ncbi:peptidoglycan-binding domain-containing protein [Alicyclobacillus herbarius]|uniref:peptidoglycan-binding domain-containing protein n=1 Tax=Alicyclobacillus herbarius TaxID=122960 RepID=UPI000557F71E|nr:peptidoglycan-binding domain-containing protein [Alicyclobacillus herbarius]
MTVAMTQDHWDYSGAPMVGPGYVTSGGLVQAVQQMIACTGEYSLTIDGIYGPQTEAAIKWWQGKNGLTKDGIVGPHTWYSFWKGLTRDYREDSPHYDSYKWSPPFGATWRTLGYRFYYRRVTNYHLSGPDTEWAYYNENKSAYYWMDNGVHKATE